MLDPVEPHIEPTNIEFSAIPETKSIRLGSGIPTIQREVGCASGIHSWRGYKIANLKCEKCGKTESL